MVKQKHLSGAALQSQIVKYGIRVDRLPDQDSSVPSGYSI